MSKTGTILTTVFVLFVFLSIVSFAMAGPAYVTSEAVVPGVSFVHAIGGAGSSIGQFIYPRYVAVGAYGDLSTGLGNIFVSDAGNNRVQVFDSDGDYMFQFGGFGSDAGKFNTPAGIAVDFNFRIYVVDRENNRLQKFDVRGNPLIQFGSFGSSAGLFSNPRGIAVDSWGRVLVADSSNNRIERFDENGNYLDSFGAFGVGNGFFYDPEDVAIDKDKYIYVADTRNNRIQVLDENGWPLLAFGSSGSGNGDFNSPGRRDRRRQLYICKRFREQQDPDIRQER